MLFRSLAPVGTLLRFGVLAPLGFLIPPVRRFAIAKASGMVINPGFSREDFDRAHRAPWLAQEIAAWLWCWAVVGLTLAGVLPPRVLLTAAAIFSLMTFLNQLRTAVAHRWDNDGEVMAPLDQFLDSVNVPPPALLPFLWAPVGLRYHALHHLMPRLPYHNLGTAHRRLVEALVRRGEPDWVNSLFLSCRFTAHRADPANFNEAVMTFFKALTPDRIDYVERCLLEHRSATETFTRDGWRIERWCPHRGADLTRFGEIDDGVLTCSLHHWKFDLATGRCLTSADRTLQCERIASGEKGNEGEDGRT